MNLCTFHFRTHVQHLIYNFGVLQNTIFLFYAVVMVESTNTILTNWTPFVCVRHMIKATDKM